jgi:two-component system response regulator GlrR
MSDDKPLILVVDDESDPRVFLFDLLESEGYRVATCEDGFEAMKVVARMKPALVISDVRMPGMDGLELLDEIGRTSPATRVILLTAYGTSEMYKDALRRGGFTLLNKPCSNQDLLEAVRRARAA